MDNLKIDFNSSENQRIKGEFVNNNVLHCASSMMYELEEKECFQEEIYELFNGMELRQEDLIRDIEEDYKEELKEWEKGEEKNIDELDEDELRGLAYDLNINIDDYEEPLEIYEYWIVNDWLGDKLKAYGEVVNDFLGFTIWGRCCTGQAILLDSVISHICNDLKLLK